MASKWFSWTDFKKYYFATSTYAKKTALAESFNHVWCDVLGSRNSLTCNLSDSVKKEFNPTNKKKFKTLLIAKGYTSAAIDGFYKCFATWLKANS